MRRRGPARWFFSLSLSDVYLFFIKFGVSFILFGIGVLNEFGFCYWKALIFWKEEYKFVFMFLVLREVMVLCAFSGYIFFVKLFIRHF